MVDIGEKVEIFRHNLFTVAWVTQEKIRRYPRVLSYKREIRQGMFGDLDVKERRMFSLPRERGSV